MSEITKDTIPQEAEHFLDELKPQKTAIVVGLYGELGAGKTTFVQSLAKVLGVTETVTSPTFVLEKIYTLKNQKFLRFIHIDAYRLECSDELRKLGFDDIKSDGGNFIVIEWADKVEDILPKNTRRVYFNVTGVDTRELRIKNCE